MSQSHRSTPAFAVGGVKPEFTCRICGIETASYPVGDVRGICEAHCADHDFEYDRERRGHYCLDCDMEKEYEPSEDDVGLGGFLPSEPIGIPASAMDGNAMNRHKNPEAWDNWVRFCEANGHP